MNPPAFSFAELAEHLQAQTQGEYAGKLTRVASLQSAGSGDIAYLADKAYLSALAQTQASVVLLDAKSAAQYTGACLVVKNPALAFVRLAQLFFPGNKSSGIHASAVIGEGAELADGVSIGPYTVIGARAVIGSGCQIGAHCSVGDNAVLGADCHLRDRVTLYPKVRLGARVGIQSGAVIGSDGFGNVPDEQGRWLHVPQLGSVLIGDDVDIGANTTIDCGALDDTIIESGVKLDNQIQIAHNVVIGAHTAIAGCVGIAGSTRIGQHCLVGGGACISGHLTIANRVMISGMSMVTKSIRSPGVYSSGTGLMENRSWHRSVVRFRQLDEIAKRLKTLEARLNETDDHS
jgi:UDP-3-O-[3-hydroxymyristoyl] glucosamine N-acyltransferase